ncbi:uncharacterized protein ACA1_202720 [Acanthamoeba castellanii str. Neff]|uniref:Uncharacterized protein n=1 Tax=Acanthamoeba castellanii (strain ATCC 30010 / Neff) TaxID=1257118 RepID=L8GSW1_ACACF|nr:uncharacterized protein ACA1_202720 [Acanthamoeba castellanii str. Neff]ELR16289.1 hypothetical protein ACA1_202720 [Acanthamoeba castellanii str. Neff]
MEAESNRKAVVAFFGRLQRQVEAWDATSVQGGTHFVKMNNLLPTLPLLRPSAAGEMQRLAPEIEAAFPDLRDKLVDQHRVLIEEHIKGIHLSMRGLGAVVRNMRRVSDEAWAHYRLHVAASPAERDAAFVRGGLALAPSFVEVVEYIDVIAKMHEKEFLQRKRLVENISYEHAAETEGLLQVWLTEPHIDKAHMSEMVGVVENSSILASSLKT